MRAITKDSNFVLRRKGVKFRVKGNISREGHVYACVYRSGAEIGWLSGGIEAARERGDWEAYVELTIAEELAQMEEGPEGPSLEAA